ncbi:hypothetical protein [Aerococcus viridans]|uniref:hypothetical protein n=1 Tax=Aerococcus TaxID=1375 RepID=UPI003AEA52F4
METKNEKFMRLAESRANVVIQKLRLIGNLSNRRNYEYTKKEVDELFNAIESEVKKTKKLFELEMEKKESSFKFSNRKD